ncbi:unnamed protein product [Lupinus luteus]|uniref:Uncharacterized protein n=1 Tax=Lupinus luteus TaxID=3873 RepID=A0AAV1VR41_LUPLU
MGGIPSGNQLQLCAEILEKSNSAAKALRDGHISVVRIDHPNCAPIHWFSPKEGWIKLNSDGVYKNLVDALVSMVREEGPREIVSMVREEGPAEIVSIVWDQAP